MTNVELLAILVGSGSKDENALELSQKLLYENDNSLREMLHADIAGLTKHKGIGIAKAVKIVAAFELGLRCSNTSEIKSKTYNTSAKIYSLIRPIIGFNKYEEFWVLFLSRSLQVIKKEKVGQGGVHATAIDMKRILKGAIDTLASSIVLCHNHPSGNITPSEQDKMLTRKIKEAAEVMDIQVIDHLVVASDNYFSFADNNML